jgi:hypothetical protein
MTLYPGASKGQKIPTQPSDCGAYPPPVYINGSDAGPYLNAVLHGRTSVAWNCQGRIVFFSPITYKVLKPLTVKTPSVLLALLHPTTTAGADDSEDPCQGPEISYIFRWGSGLELDASAVGEVTLESESTGQILQVQGGWLVAKNIHFNVCKLIGTWAA